MVMIFIFGNQHNRPLPIRPFHWVRSDEFVTHDSGFVWLRPDGLDANNYFNNLNGVPVPDFHRYQWCGSVGGPIKKNKWAPILSPASVVAISWPRSKYPPCSPASTVHSI